MVDASPTSTTIVGDMKATNVLAGNNKEPRVPLSMQMLLISSAAGDQGNDVISTPPCAKSPGRTNARGIGSIFRKNQKKLQSSSGPAAWARNLREIRSSKKKKDVFPILEISIPTADIVSRPQEFLERIWADRGYPKKSFNSLETAYHNSPPTDLQLASYSVMMQGFIGKEEVDKLSEHLAAGLSPNACNGYGESMLHYACRRGHLKSVQVLVQYGARVQICDDYGRTPLHDACWSTTPNLGVVDLLLQQDVGLLRIRDRRGYLPLDYVKKEHWMNYHHYFEEEIDHFWPYLMDISYHPEYPFLANLGPHQSPVPDPIQIVPLPVNLATLLSQGRITPSEASVMKKEQILARNKLAHSNSVLWGSPTKSKEEATTSSAVETDDDNTSQHDSDSDDDSSSCDESDDTSSIDENEWKELLESLEDINLHGESARRPISW